MKTKTTPGRWYVTASDPAGAMIVSDDGTAVANWPAQGGTPEQVANARLMAEAASMRLLVEHAARMDVAPDVLQKRARAILDRIAAGK